MGGRRSCSVLSSLLLRSLGRKLPRLLRKAPRLLRKAPRPHAPLPPRRRSSHSVALLPRPPLLAIVVTPHYMVVRLSASLPGAGSQALSASLPPCTPCRLPCFAPFAVLAETAQRGAGARPKSAVVFLSTSFRLNSWAVLAVRVYKILFSLCAVSPCQLIGKCIYHSHRFRAVI